MSYSTPLITPKLKIIATPPLLRSFLLPYSHASFFTGDPFDRLVLFLYKHYITYTSIECVARGVDKATALAEGPAICVYIVQEDDSGVGKCDKEDHDKKMREGLNGERSRSRGKNMERRQMGRQSQGEERKEVAVIAAARKVVAMKQASKEEVAEKDTINEEDSGEGEVGGERESEKEREQDGGKNKGIKSEKGQNIDNSSVDCEKEQTDLDSWKIKRQEKQDETTRPQTLEQKTNIYTSKIAHLFRESNFAQTIPPEIFAIEFVSVIRREDRGRTTDALGTCRSVKLGCAKLMGGMFGSLCGC